ncbi:hypothetical protein EUGRSUZ_L03451 [Eucalyptus grandis]|uniref:25S rRNA (uridine-N(3))-methyltransferase BMT5-like domain-containing protein n=1 Tax=Eucalyptus grandis TaxID=71139 RepID=A0AAD9T8M6_EUCGR|nr:hypothetical protein EUGRSUZ_L03451 [Eucalyptus grandis]
MHVKKKKRSIKHYSNLHKILLVGEGDFSFAVCLAQAFGSAVNIVATSVDSQVDRPEKCRQSGCTKERAPNIEILEGLGGTILHEVDAHNMTEHPDPRHKSSDRIVFNFLHTGYKGHDHSNSQIQRHQELVRAFLKSARSMLTRNGEIHVTHKTAYPFSKWEIEKLAEEDEKLRLVEKAKFSESDYSGYVNKRGDGS